jgi:hypothetical protein
MEVGQGQNWGCSDKGKKKRTNHACQSGTPMAVACVEYTLQASTVTKVQNQKNSLHAIKIMIKY